MSKPASDSAARVYPPSAEIIAKAARVLHVAIGAAPTKKPASGATGVAPHGQGFYFSVVAAGRLGKTLANHLTVTNQHTAHMGIGHSPILSTPGQLQGAGHHAGINGGIHARQGKWARQADSLSSSEASRGSASSLSIARRNSAISSKLRYTEAKRT